MDENLIKKNYLFLLSFLYHHFLSVTKNIINLLTIKKIKRINFLIFTFKYPNEE